MVINKYLESSITEGSPLQKPKSDSYLIVSTKDAEFISYFINEVFEETVNKETIELKIKKLEMEYDIEKKAYENFYIKVKFYNLVKQ